MPDTRILYIEDEKPLCKLFKAAVAVHEYTVDVAYNGEDGLAMHADNPYDLIAIDHELPNVMGIDIAQKLLAENPDLAVVMVVGKGSEKVAAEALALGVASYVIKGDESVYSDLLPGVIQSALMRSTEAIKYREIETALRICPSVTYTTSAAEPFETTFITENVRDQMGFEPDEFLTDPNFWANQIHPDDAARVLGALPDLFEVGHHFCEYRVRHKDGSYRWIWDELKLVYDAHGKPKSIVGYRIDISKQKRTEKEQVESRNWLISAIESIDGGAAIYDSNDCLVTFNQNYGRHLSDIADLLRPGVDFYELERALVERGYYEAVFDDIDAWIAQHTAGFRDGKHSEEHQNKYGAWRQVFYYKLKSGGTFVIISDFTDRKRVEDALRESEQRYRILFDNAAAGIGRSRIKDGKVLLANNKLAELFGYDSVDEFIEEFVFTDHYADVDERNTELDHYRRIAHRAYDLRLTKRDGSVIVVQTDGRLNEEAGYIDFVVIDITERKRLEEALR